MQPDLTGTDSSSCERLEEFVDNPIQVEALTKSYGSFPAVKGIDFEVRAGEVFGMLGPNGAGKTTTVEILEGLRTRSGGRVSVLGCDPEVQTRQLKDRVGVCLQANNLQEKLKVCEAMELFARVLHAHRGCHAALEAPAALGEARHRLRANSRADKNSASRWRWPCSTIPRCSFSMSPRPAWIRRRAWRSTSLCSPCAASSAPS